MKISADGSAADDGDPAPRPCFHEGMTGRPDCPYEGGGARFVRVTNDYELAFPSYDGNCRTIGNLSTHSQVTLLFIDFDQPPPVAI